MKHIRHTIYLVLLASIIFGCSENATNINAEQMTLQNLSKTPGFTWIYMEIEKYNPNDSIINEIQTAFNAELHSFVVFAKPSCSCPGKHLQTPAFIKTLETAGIPIDKCEIFSMSSANNKHPYDELITVKELPTIVVMKAGQPVFSVSETINNMNATNPNSGITVEQALLLGLAK